ncbi:extracellular solute-binding protein [Paenibacillus sp. CC-CFT747]|nr:extracellular solute-binding protein [Paenibacillus sp. CC-CFT747]
MITPGKAYESVSDRAVVSSSPLDGKSSPLVLEKDKEWVTYRFNIPEDGLYNLELTYRPMEGSYSQIQIGVQVDGDYPFKEARTIQLFRSWKDGKYPPDVNEHGDQIRPAQAETPHWSTVRLMDANSSAEPLLWAFTKGEHTIRVESILESVALDSISVVSPEPLPTYEQKAAAAPKKSLVTPAWGRTLEAEHVSGKSDPSVQIQASNDNLASPPSNGRITYNMLGGSRWSRSGNEAEWAFEVPEDGLYYLSFKFMQNFTRDVYTYRQIRLDGEVPFRELEAYPFPYSRSWQIETLSDPDGKAYGLYLTKGQHVLSLSAVAAPTASIRESIQTIVDDLQAINRTVSMATGVKNRRMVDRNRDWKLDDMIPDIQERAAALADRLQSQINKLQTLYGSSLQSADGLRAVIRDIREIEEDPNILVTRPPEMWAGNLDKMSAFVDSLAKQPLTLDQIYLTASPEVPEKPPGRLAVLQDTVVNFFRTFRPDYHYSGRNDPDAIDIWVNRGRDYVNLMQQLADESFTPQTGVKVNINLMPNPGQLILSNSSGREPDLALGLPEGTPADFAMRNSLVDLSTFKDYKDVVKPLHPGTLIPFQYDGGTYALPETVSLNVMFYRTDILESLDLKPPQTWDEMLAMLPTLKQKGYDFYYNKANSVPIFLQNGVSFYTSDGLKSGLNSPEGFKAFKQWTDLFNVYGFPTEVPNFYQHFRSGDLPIGISDYNTYMQLLVAAPELNGSWEIAPVPGVGGQGQEPVRWSGGSLTSGMIFKSTKHKEEAWSFLKWWTSTDTQARFGNEVELLNGVEFRWNTANVEAFKKLPWPSGTKETILEQWRWYKEMPNVPGGYFTGREMLFAWNRTVLQGLNYRESLEQAIFQVDSELKRKQKEFGFLDENGEVRRTLVVPDITKPWEGAQP